ncbi:MAG: thymidine phosphorylase, partial [Sulfobacillus thermotolerans]|nr:thymidine phosphorylase [Sulfobacillus thermotolerans]
PIAKMSGRGLGHTGGTLDKLESIPGFRVDLPPDTIRAQVEKIGVAVVAQSSSLAPADKRLYALRDVTATVDSIPLIASSIMSKKLASGTRHMVLDVKVGNGAFMTTLERARELAQLMVKIGAFHQRHVTAILTTMNEPLGWAVGNAIEVNEAVACLKGQGPSDLRTLVIALAAALDQSVNGTDADTAHARASQALDSGKAWEVFVRWIQAQGGDPQSIEQPLPLAPVTAEVRAPNPGWISSIQTQALGEVALELGAGRHELGEQVDFGVGLECFAKIGQHFDQDELVARIYARTPLAAENAIAGVQQAFSWSASQIPAPALILDRIASA